VKKLLKWLVAQVLRLFCPKPVILFESTPDFADNTYPVYEELCRRGFDKKYKLVWDCGGNVAPEGFTCVFPHKGLKEKLKRLRYMAGARCMISCNRFVLPMRGGQVAFYLTHGTPLKSVRGYYTVPGEITYCFAASKGVEQVTAYEFCVKQEKMVSLGFPRNDVFAQMPVDVKKLLGTDCKKVLVWYPTFRQHNNGRTAGSGKALPVIHDGAAATRLNALARELGVLLVLKPHFAQDVSAVKDLQLSNIRFIDDRFFEEKGTTSYAFVAGCDGLITDYSSIYFDYLLTDKPIGLVWEDIEEYRENPGFAMDPEQCCAGGRKIYTIEDFEEFIREIAEGKDSCADARRQLRDRFNFSIDGQNTRRVTDFIIEKAKL
jgi:CDP-glycerol glycerophosphotransferase (TagB/SpsB family)